MLRPGQPFGILGQVGMEHERAEAEKQREAPTERPWRAVIIFGLGISSLPSPSWKIVRLRSSGRSGSARNAWQRGV